MMDASIKIKISLLRALLKSRLHQQVTGQAAIKPIRNIRVLRQDLAVLFEFDRRLQKKRNTQSPILFHSTFRKISGTYDACFSWVEHLGIPISPVVKSADHFISEYKPFSHILNYPMIKEELYWLTRQPLTVAIAKQIRLILQYNFSVFHEALHKTFYSLIPTGAFQDRQSYFNFVEALAFTNEFIFIQEIGPQLNSLLFQLNMCYRKYSSRYLNQLNVNECEDFYKILLSYWAFLEFKKPDKFSPYQIRHQDFMFPVRFASQVVPDWHQRKDLFIEKTLVKNHLGRDSFIYTKKLNYKQFVANADLRRQFFNWHHKTLYTFS